MKTIYHTYTNPLTKRDALEITAEMWDWLAENPHKTKYDWVYLNKGRIPHLALDCACCEYVKQIHNLEFNPSPLSAACNSCPLFSLWGNNCCHSNNDSNSSPYHKWSSCHETEKSSIFAKQIADAARAELKKMDAEDKYKLKALDIIEESKAKSYRPWKPEEVPIGALLRTKLIPKHVVVILGVVQRSSIWPEVILSAPMVGKYNKTEYINDLFTYHGGAYNDRIEYSVDCGKTWRHCGIEE